MLPTFKEEHVASIFGSEVRTISKCSGYTGLVVFTIQGTQKEIRPGMCPLFFSTA
jgi:hypothetical protein